MISYSNNPLKMFFAFFKHCFTERELIVLLIQMANDLSFSLVSILEKL